MIKARRVQERRLRGKSREAGSRPAGKIVTNSEMTNRDIKEFCKIDDEAREVLKQALLRLSLSARSYHKVVKIAQTIADLDSSNSIQREHVLEALQYRPKLDNS